MIRDVHAIAGRVACDAASGRKGARKEARDRGSVSDRGVGEVHAHMVRDRSVRLRRIWDSWDTGRVKT